MVSTINRVPPFAFRQGFFRPLAASDVSVRAIPPDNVAIVVARSGLPRKGTIGYSPSWRRMRAFRVCGNAGLGDTSASYQAIEACRPDG